MICGFYVLFPLIPAYGSATVIPGRNGGTQRGRKYPINIRSGLLRRKNNMGGDRL
jgi:hypothetical protein